MEADFACGPGNDDRINQIVEEARDKEIEPILDFYLEKHRHIVTNFRDSRTLTRLTASRGLSDSFTATSTTTTSLRREAVRVTRRG